jgi:hypothetical protein
VLLSFAAIIAWADSMTNTDNIQVNGSYHSVTSGVPNYDGGFKRTTDDAAPSPMGTKANALSTQIATIHS